MKIVGHETAQDEVDGRSLLDEIAREGARRMLVAALETEVAAYLEAHREERDAEGHALVVRSTRKVTVGAGTIPLSAPRVSGGRRAKSPCAVTTFSDANFAHPYACQAKGRRFDPGRPLS